MDKVGGQDARNGAIDSRSGHAQECPGVASRRDCVFLQTEDISQPHRWYSPTDEVPCGFTALDGSNRVLHSLLDVRTAEEGGSCVY